MRIALFFLHERKWLTEKNTYKGAKYFKVTLCYVAVEPSKKETGISTSTLTTTGRSFGFEHKRLQTSYENLNLMNRSCPDS